MNKNKNFVFIVTYGRSGSTLLQGILNGIEGYLIRGENHMAFKHLHEYYKKMLTSRDASFNFSNDPTNPWWNDFSDEHLKYCIRKIVASLIDPSDKFSTLGFKEIRYPHLQKEEILTKVLDWMDYIFEPKFIYLIRNLDAVKYSKWWAKDPEGSKKRLQSFEKRMEEHISYRPEQEWYHIKLKDITSKTGISDLMDFLNASIEEDKLDKILDTKHSY